MIPELISAVTQLAPIVAGPIGLAMGASNKQHTQDTAYASETAKILPEVNMDLKDWRSILVFNVSAWLRKLQKAWWSIVFGYAYILAITDDTITDEIRSAIFSSVNLVACHFFGRNHA